MRRALVTLALLIGCVDAGPRGPANSARVPTRDATSFLVGALRPWPRQDSTGLLLAHQVTSPGDARDGLVCGGMGTIHYDLEGDAIREVFEPGEIRWASVEHNIDAYFAFRALARVTEAPIYAQAARRIAAAL